MNDNNYVNDEVFRSELRRIEQKVENAVERIELKMDVYTARMDGKVGRIEARMDSLTHFVGWTIALVGIVVAVSAIFIPLLK